jgi:alpha-L-arabinofuranosidase
VDALKRQGITAIRYNGSMVDCGTDPYNYRWKKMLGPIDERRVTYRSGFSPYATHSFGFIEMLQLAEVIDAECIIGMSMDETSQDISDFVEYVNGSADTKWGARRVADGHPAPYNLKYIQVDNERVISQGYIEMMKKFALAAWKVDPEMNIMTSLNLHSKRYDKGNPEYDLALQLVRWFVAQGKGDKLAWDPHFDGGDLGWAATDKFHRQLGLNLKRDLEADVPGFTLKLHPMEENGWRCDWYRGLAHAHNYNKIQRYGDSFKMVGTANTFQPHGLHYMWDQGRIHFNSHELWFMPSAYIDEELAKHWFTNVVETSSSDEKTLDVTAKMNDAGDSLFVYVANISEHDQTAELSIENFKYKSKVEVWSIGGCDLTETNTVDNKMNVSPKVSKATLSKKNAKYTFPRYSYTIIKLKR